MIRHQTILFFILLFAHGLGASNDSISVQPGSIIIDFRNLNYNEKVDTLIYIKKKSNKIILYSSYYNLEVHNIISIEGNSIEVELLDYWWWNKPKQPVFNKMSPIETISNRAEPSLRKIISIQDIIKIRIIKKKPLIIVLLPALVILVVMKAFGL